MNLERALQEWRMASPLPPRFGEQVWSRIERAEAPTISLPAALRVWLTSTFARPAFVVAFVSTLLLLGLACGAVQANYRAGRVERQLEARYMQSVDPYLRSP